MEWSLNQFRGLNNSSSYTAVMGSKLFDKQTLARVLACSVLNAEKKKRERKKEEGRKESNGERERMDETKMLSMVCCNVSL
jgi:hypothetical protein